MLDEFIKFIDEREKKFDGYGNVIDKYINFTSVRKFCGEF